VESGLQARIEAMSAGEDQHNGEPAVLHDSPAHTEGGSIVVDGENVVPKVHTVLDKMARFSDRIRSGEWKGHTGRRIRNVHQYPATEGPTWDR